jgi:hypothetical protein
MRKILFLFLSVCLLTPTPPRKGKYAKGFLVLTGAVVGVLEEQETESHDGGPPHVVIHIRHRHVQQLPDSLVVPCTAVRHRDGVHPRPTKVGEGS